MGKPHQARKKHNYLELRQSSSRKGVGGGKKKKIQNEPKRTLTYFDKLRQS